MKSALRILHSNAKSENGFNLWELCPRGESGFHGLPFFCSTGKSEKRFAKLFSWTSVFFLLIMHARARPLFLRTVCQSFFGFPNRTVQRKSINRYLKSKIRILRSKSRFPNRKYPQKKKYSYVVSSIRLLEKTDSSAKNTWWWLLNLRSFF